jgi:hypothetical protein
MSLTPLVAAPQLHPSTPQSEPGPSKLETIPQRICEAGRHPNQTDPPDSAARGQRANSLTANWQKGLGDVDWAEPMQL